MFTIVNALKSDRIAGLSLLGGDPLWQDTEGLTQLWTLCLMAQAIGKTVWIWSGFTWEQIFSQIANNEQRINRMLQQLIIRNCDVWVDGQFDISKRDLRLKWRGSKNQRVIDIKSTIQTGNIVELYK